MIFPWFKKSKSDSAEIESNAKLLPYEALLQALRRLQCEIIPQPENSDADNSNSDVVFKYQQNCFIASFIDRYFIRLLMPNAIRTEIENFNEVRYLCNILSSKRNIIIPFFIISDDERELNLTLSATISVDSPAGFAEKLPSLFEKFQEEAVNVVQQFQTMIKHRGEKNPYDFEVDYLHQIRKVIILRESERQHLNYTNPDKPEITQEITLSDFLNHTIGIDPKDINAVDIVASDGSVRSLNSQELTSYSLVSDIWKGALADNDSDSDTLKYPSLANDWVIIRVRSTYPADLNTPGVITISLSDYGHDMRAAYIRAVVTTEGNEPLRGTDVGNKRVQPSALKTIIRIVPDGESSARSEYEFMFTDAREKIAAGKEDELTPEQKLLTRAFVSNTGYYLYHGTRHFNAARYAQALMMLMNVYDDMIARYSRMDDEARGAFRDVCFMIGFCYTDFKRYDRAYYYLSQIFNFGELDHDQEYINCLVNMNDPRALDIVNTSLENIESFIKENADSVHPAIIEMFNFLRRRKAYLHIELRQFDQAETLLHEMINEEPNHSFAIDELTYIQHLKEND